MKMKTTLKNIFSHSDYSKKLIQGVVLLWITTFIHHIYGAVAYSTLWRVIAPILIFPILLYFTIVQQNKLIKYNNNKSISILKITSRKNKQTNFEINYQ